MKKAFVLLLLVFYILTGCGKEPNADPTQSNTTPTVSVSTEPSQATVPTEAIVSETTEQVETIPVVHAVSPTKDPVKNPEFTVPQETGHSPIDSLETRPAETTPVETIPAETQIPEPIMQETQPSETTVSVKPSLDMDAAIAFGNQYAQSAYGWISDSSLTMENAGYYFPTSTTEESCNARGGQTTLEQIVQSAVDFTYEALVRKFTFADGALVNCYLFLDEAGIIWVYVLYA